MSTENRNSANIFPNPKTKIYMNKISEKSNLTKNNTHTDIQMPCMRQKGETFTSQRAQVLRKIQILTPRPSTPRASRGLEKIGGAMEEVEKGGEEARA